jgi:hypothetical protein
MWHSNPVVGVGKGQYMEHHGITAHNSFILVLGELGTVGIFIWITAIYVAFKSLMVAARYAQGPEGRLARVWSNNVLIALCPLMAGSFFLSFAHHAVFWTYMGVAGAVVGAIRRHRPDFEVKLGALDVILIIAIVGSITLALEIHLRMKGFI